MPLSQFQREEAAAYAFARVGYSRGQDKVIDVMEAYVRRFGQPPTDPGLWTLRATIQGVFNGITQGEEIQTGPGGDAVRPRFVDWALSNQNDAYGWRVRLYARNPDTGEQTERLIIVTSNTILTADQIRQRATDSYMEDPLRGGRYNDKTHWTNQVQVTAEIVSAGRNI